MLILPVAVTLINLYSVRMSDKHKQPVSTEVFDKANVRSALDYIEHKWRELRRFEPENKGTLIGLPYPYIVPSARASSGFTFDEMYYWDSYLIAQGLLRGKHKKLASGMLENLMYMGRKFDIIPNGSRLYYTSRSQPPILTSYIMDIYEYKKDLVWLQQSIATAEYEYNTVWMADKQPNWRNVFHGLSRYYDINVIDGLAEAEAGWDTTTRFSDACLSYIPIDLNSLLYKYESDFARASSLLGDMSSSERWERKATERKETVNNYLWNEEKGFYFDYNFHKEKQGEIWSLAGFYPLWTGMASEEQAARLVHNLDKFMQVGGLSTTTKPTEIPVEGTPNHQWSYPNGWAPLHWLVVRGLERYGYHEQAGEIARKWLETNMAYFLEHGVFREAYNVTNIDRTPEPGLYPPQLGFGWTNGVFVDLAVSYLEEASHWQQDRNNPNFKNKLINKLKEVKTVIRNLQPRI